MFELKPYTRKNNGVYYNPFQTMDEFERNFFNPSFFETTLEQFKTDIKDDGDSYTLQADLPGFDKKDIHLDLNNDVLTISAERHSEHEDKDKKGKFVRCERSYGTYTRQFDVSNINTDEGQVREWCAYSEYAQEERTVAYRKARGNRIKGE